MDNEGAVKLYRSLITGDATVSKPYFDESPLVDELPSLEYAEIKELGDGETVTRTMRAHIRYIAALFPDLSLAKVATRIHALLNNQHLTEDDIRLILQGRSIYDPTRLTNEVKFEKIQLVGSCLAKGMSARSTAITVGMSLQTVLNIDHFLGITKARESNLIQKACDAVRYGVTVRQFAQQVDEPKSTAHRIMVRARAVLAELGELEEETTNDN
jgi:hypothetical protein